MTIVCICLVQFVEKEQIFTPTGNGKIRIPQSYRRQAEIKGSRYAARINIYSVSRNAPSNIFCILHKAVTYLKNTSTYIWC